MQRRSNELKKKKSIQVNQRQALKGKNESRFMKETICRQKKKESKAKQMIKQGGNAMMGKHGDTEEVWRSSGSFECKRGTHV